MTTEKEVSARLAKNEILCKGHGPDGEHFWLEPSRITVPSPTAKKLIPMLEPGGDRLFTDTAPQTYKVRGPRPRS